MQKFFVLLKKELRELITPQLIAPLVIMMVLFVGVGEIVGGEIEKAEVSQDIIFVDNDNTELSRSVTQRLSESGLNLIEPEGQDVEAMVNHAKREKIPGVVIIESGFESSVISQSPAPVIVYSVIRDFSVLGNQKIASISRATSLISESAKNEILQRSAQNINPEFLAKPIAADQNVVVGQQTAAISPQIVLGFVSSQATFIPVILFIVIVLASQLIATTMASEKENKTIETLLAAPVKRTTIVTAKLIGAGIVAGIMAVIYMIGFRSYLGGLTGSATDALSTPEITNALQQLGLNFSSGDFMLLGLSLFMGMLAALSIAMLLGAFVEDVKSVPGVISPLMVLIAIPYFLTLFLDIGSLSAWVRYLTYAIPFSHPFLASPNILLDRYDAVWYGILYQTIFFLLFVWIVARVFSSDKILTMKLKLFKKKS